MEQEIAAIQNLTQTVTTFGVTYGFQMVGAIIIIVVGLFIGKWVGRLVERLCDARNFDVTLSRFFANVAKVLVLVFVAIIALGKFGITIAPFIAAIGAIAFGASLAIQGPLSNYGAGIAIILGRPFVVGNTITVLDVSGVVEEVRLGATLLSTEDGEIITIPNKQILGEILHNSFASKVVESRIGISYTDDPDRAIAVIHDMLATVSEVTKEPSPQVGIENFADSAIEIGYRYWVPTQQYFQIRYAVNRAVYNGLMTAGINIPYPKLDVTVENQGSGG